MQVLNLCKTTLPTRTKIEQGTSDGEVKGFIKYHVAIYGTLLGAKSFASDD